MIRFLKKNQKGETIISNIRDSSEILDKKEKVFESGSGVLSIFSDDSYILSRSKVFNKLGEFCCEAFESIFSYFSTQNKAQSHSLKKIQGQLIQKMESIIKDQSFFGKDYLEQKRILLEYAQTHPDHVADVLLYSQKRIFEIGAHISSYDILHMGEQIVLDRRPHNIRRLLINILHAFEDQLNELAIKPHFMFEDQFADIHKLNVDYKTINAAFYNFFDNVVKYVKPGTEIRFYFLEDEKLVISMRSLKIERDELSKIFNLGYRGKNCAQEEGTGVGMYVVKKALNLNQLDIDVSPNYSDSEVLSQRFFILNKFAIFPININR